MKTISSAPPLLLLLLQRTHAILPTGGLTLHYTPSTSTSPTSQIFLTSEASFGAILPMANSQTPPTNVSPPLTPIQAQSDMCTLSDQNTQLPSNTILFVPRGTCTFNLKALNAQKIGAAAVVIYNTLSSRYSVNETTSEIIYPLDKHDYDCDYGRDVTSISAGSVVYPYANAASANDALAERTGSTFEKCASRRALFTGRTSEDGQFLEACCAWDLHVWLYADAEVKEQVTIPSVFITITQQSDIAALISGSRGGSVSVDVYQRWRPEKNASAVLIWALGVFVAWLASWASAGELRDKKKMVVEGPRVRRNSRENMLGTVDREVEITGSGSSGGVVRSGSSTPAVPPPNVGHDEGPNGNEDQVELTMGHAIVFMVFASASLFILFFFQIYNVVKVMYAFGCSGAMSQVIFRPLFAKVSYKCCPEMNIHKSACNIQQFEIGHVSYLDLLSTAAGYAVGMIWLAVAFLVAHPEQLPFFWITQNVMGACICLTFLEVIKLNRLKVATVLLSVAFFYDIFFVFITPYIFKGESIMITVATSGGPPTADPTWCEKYPKSDGCQGGDPLPMLFTIPRLFDYQGGSSLLGLGDVVLPGLLLSFGARLDEAKRLIGLSRGGRGSLNGGDRTCPTDSKCCGWARGYFFPLVVAYALGLIMANAAVYLMKMGQPALLYLVPLTLGTMSFQGWRRGEFWDLWNGPKVLMAAERFEFDIVERHADSADEGRGLDAGGIL